MRSLAFFSKILKNSHQWSSLLSFEFITFNFLLFDLLLEGTLYLVLFCHHCHDRRDIDVKFPCDSTKSVQPANHFELVNQLKETKWKKERTSEDMQREQELLDQAKFSYEIKKKEFVRFLAEMSSYMSQVILNSVPLIIQRELFFVYLYILNIRFIRIMTIRWDEHRRLDDIGEA